MNAYLLKPVSIEQLRTTLERWLPIRGENSANGPGDRKESAAAIDREVLAGWLGDDHAAIDSLLRKFCETAVETEREIDAVSDTGNLATLAAAAHKHEDVARGQRLPGRSEPGRCVLAGRTVRSGVHHRRQHRRCDEHSNRRSQ